MTHDIDFEFARSIGATHYKDFPHLCEWYKEIGEEWYYYSMENKVWRDCSEVFKKERVKAIPIPEGWSIYTNDKPLCELSDEQAAQLFNAWIRGEQRIAMEPNDEIAVCNNSWYKDAIYRIKPKSERELFIEHCRELVDGAKLEPVTDEYFKTLFDAGCRFN